MKIVRLQSENIMRLTAVDITPEGNLVTIGGKNGAGKSSVLNSIAMALGGLALAPVEPIRTGELTAQITLDIGDFVVTRRFSRERVIAAAKDGHAHSVDAQGNLTCGCSYQSGVFTDTRSVLTVTNKDGARYGSPQAMLDKLLGKLTFDPLAFAQQDAKSQHATLRALLGLDTRALDAERGTCVTQRTLTKRTMDTKSAAASALRTFDGVPAEEIPLLAVSQRMLDAEHKRRAADDAQKVVDSCDEHLKNVRAHQSDISARMEATAARIGELQHQLETMQQQFDALDGEVAQKAAEHARAIEALAKAKRAVPDIAKIQQELAAVEGQNVKVRANKAAAAAMAEIEALASEIHKLTDRIAALDQHKTATLASAQYPVEGLGLSDDGVTFNGLPLSQASSSEQLRVSVAIGLALNPKLKVLLIRNGNLLDEDSLALVAKQAETADAQVWMEYVTSHADDVQVMIEDGHRV